MTQGVFRGKVWTFGDDINTDLIIPSFVQYVTAEEMAPHCFSANRPGWVDEMSAGDVIVAGRNFGVGSGRAIGNVFVILGVSGIVAESFNGLGMRNCVNVGLPVLPCPGILDVVSEGDVIEVDWTTGKIHNETQQTTTEGQPVPDLLQNLVKSGGIEPMLRREGYLRDPFAS
jgi:3-isopropylmalate/(R)-2-methylmalate dehydratase small subunit